MTAIKKNKILSFEEFKELRDNASEGLINISWHSNLDKRLQDNNYKAIDFFYFENEDVQNSVHKIEEAYFEVYKNSLNKRFIKIQTAQFTHSEGTIYWDSFLCEETEKQKLEI